MKIRASLSKTILAAAGVGLLVLLLKARAIDKIYDSLSNGDPFVLVIAMLLLVVALVFVIGFRKKMTLFDYARKQEPVITMDESGFFDHRYMAMPIPWGKVAGFSYGSDFSFNKVTIRLVSGEKIEKYFRPDMSGVLDPMSDFEYTFSSYELELNEFQLDDLVKKYLPARVVENSQQA